MDAYKEKEKEKENDNEKEKDKDKYSVNLLRENRITNLKKTTRITICNYEDYQDGLHGDQTLGKRNTNARQTLGHPNNNDNNDNNEKKEKHTVVCKEKSNEE